MFRTLTLSVGCLAHARRKFEEAVKVQKTRAGLAQGGGAQTKNTRGGLAKQRLALIDKIYRVEKLARDAGLNAQVRQKLCDEKTRPLWQELRQWLDRSRHRAPPKTLVGKALGYLDENWPQPIAQYLSYRFAA